MTGVTHPRPQLRPIRAFLLGLTFLACVPASPAPADPCGVWYELSAPTRPHRRAGHVMIYDGPRQRTIVSGGLTDQGVLLTDLWQHTHAGGYTLLTPSGTAPMVWNLPFIHDQVRDRMLVASGNTLWSLALAAPAWSSTVTSGPAPPGGSKGICDPVNDRMLVVGLSGGVTRVWALELSNPSSTWTLLVASNSPTQFNQVAVYDSRRHRILILVGHTSPLSGPLQPKLWELPLTGLLAWNLLHPAGTPPEPRHSAAAIYDSLRDRVVLHGGIHSIREPQEECLTDTWAIGLEHGPSYMNLTPSTGTFGRRGNHGMVYDRDRDAATVFGGNGNVATFASTTFADDTRHLEFGLSLHVAASPGAVGSVTTDPSPLPVCLEPGSTVTLTATPNPGRSFVGWSGDASGSTNPLTVVMDQHKTIFANFDSPTAVDDVGTKARLGISDVEWARDGREGIVTLSLPAAGRATVEVLDLAGRRLARETLEGPGRGIHRVHVRPSQPLSSGIHFVRVRQAGASAHRKFVWRR